MARSTRLFLVRAVAIDEPEARELLPHPIDVETQLARLQALAHPGLLGFPGSARVRNLGGFQPRNDAYAVVVGYNDIARMNQGAGADDRYVHTAQSLLHRALGGYDLRPHRKAHRREVADIPHPGIDHQAFDSSRLQRAAEQLTEVTGVGV